jgi:hypothetical protein
MCGWDRLYALLQSKKRGVRIHPERAPIWLHSGMQILVLLPQNVSAQGFHAIHNIYKLVVMKVRKEYT